MLATPSTSPRRAFADRTNAFSQNSNRVASSALPTPPKDSKPISKRRANENSGTTKRVKLSKDAPCPVEGDESESDVDVDPFRVVTMNTRRCSTYSILCARARGGRSASQVIPLSTRPILQTFVSSFISDVFKVNSIDNSAFLSPPYACAFSHASKKGQAALLAIATEQGSVELLNTSKRRDCEFEPPRQSVQVHMNGVFDVKWSHCDTMVATASGDNTACITDLGSETVLHKLKGHTKTVKCAAWDPNHRDLICTAGRDGTILMWDLRHSSRKDGEMLPAIYVQWAHEPQAVKRKKKSKVAITPRSVTSLVYLPHSPYEIVSSCSADGILRKWDFRYHRNDQEKLSKQANLKPIDECAVDPTVLKNGSRPRGISSIALGSGPSEAMLFGLGNDSKIHTYNSCGASGVPLSINQGHTFRNTYNHHNMSTNSFYVKIGVSPCGRWLASGGANGRAFLFDIASRRDHVDVPPSGLELLGQDGEVGAIDWADNQLATCADDGTVRIWRPDFEVRRKCADDPEEAKWRWNWAR